MIFPALETAIAIGYFVIVCLICGFFLNRIKRR